MHKTAVKANKNFKMCIRDSNMYFTRIDDNDYAIKPMNCPGSMLVYKRKMWSYRDLPLRIGEMGQVHRHELSGALHGLMRVRTFTQDDAHTVSYTHLDVYKRQTLTYEFTFFVNFCDH